MADHARRDGTADDKRAALAGASSAHNAYRHTTPAYEHLPQQPQRPQPQGGRDGNSGRDNPVPLSKMSLGQFARRYSVYILSVVAVAVVVVALIFGVRAFSELLDEPLEVEVGYTSPYDWSKLDRTDGRFAYVDGGQVKSRLGVDVSSHQYDIDWDAVAADGVDFAMIRLGYRGATEGDLYLDEFYEANLAGAKAAGLDCGVYFFSQAQNTEEAIEEADFVIEHLGGAMLEYPIAFDSEEKVLDLAESRTTGLTADEMTAIMEAFCNRVEQAGYRSMVYGNRIDLARFNDGSLEGRRIWWAEYGVNAPSEQVDIVMWQYSNAGQVAGIQTGADMNIDLSGALL